LRRVDAKAYRRGRQIVLRAQLTHLDAEQNEPKSLTPVAHRRDLAVDATLRYEVRDMLNIVHQSVQLPATPEALYAMYLDPLQHAAITGSPLVRIAPTPGAEFWAFDGRIHGLILAVTPGRQIVQSWRSFEWPADDLDATLVLTFRADPAGARLDMALVNVPEALRGKLQTNWPMRYWEPWKAYLARPR
jgi:activator of HSP90 ATPase